MEPDELKLMYRHAIAYQLLYSRFSNEHDSIGLEHYGDIQKTTYDIQEVLREELDDWAGEKETIQQEVLEEIE